MLTDKIIILDYSAINQQDALQYLADRLVQVGAVKKSYPEAIIQREKKFPTGLNTENVGIAIPHTDAGHVNHEQIGVLRLTEPVTFLQMGDEEQVAVKLIFMLALKKPHEQLDMLRKLMDLIQNKYVVEQLLETQNVTDMIRILKKSGIQ